MDPTGAPEGMSDDQRYAAISARDARFDGLFVTCVRSTGIFCRPSCPARTPDRRRVDFVPTAAAAIEAGFRACKRCGPAAPPGSPDDDPSGSLAGRALRLIDQGELDGEGTVPALARRLAVSERTLHRALVARTGAGALAHARQRRARRAHDLVAGSDLPLARIAHAAGFSSERQFHETFTRIYGHAPSLVRERARGRRGPAKAGPTAGVADDAATLHAQLSVRRPFDAPGLASWFSRRAIPGVERVDGLIWSRALRLPHGTGVARVDLAVQGALPLTLCLTDLRDHAPALALVRRMLDLDADPQGIDEGLRAASPALGELVRRRPGVRLPGLPTIAEGLLWAIVGQQITTDQAREQITRATDRLGEPLPAALHVPGIERLPVDPLLAAEHAEDWFRGPGSRVRALQHAAIPGALPPEESLPVAELRSRLLALPGVGPWTADYVLLRAVRAIDVAPPRDAALLGAARQLGLATDQAELSAALAAAAPWRSYAALHLWHLQASPTDARPAPPADPAGDPR